MQLIFMEIVEISPKVVLGLGRNHLKLVKVSNEMPKNFTIATKKIVFNCILLASNLKKYSVVELNSVRMLLIEHYWLLCLLDDCFGKLR